MSDDASAGGGSIEGIEGGGADTVRAGSVGAVGPGRREATIDGVLAGLLLACGTTTGNDMLAAIGDFASPGSFSAAT